MSLRRNVLANYVGQGWAAVMAIAFVPLYVRALGAESYGLIGVFTILQAWLALLDFGLTPTLNREMAQLRTRMQTVDHVRDLLRSLETIYAALAVAMILGLWFSAAWLVADWLRVDRIAPDVVVASLRLMGFVLAARWLEQIYRAALQGLEDQVWLNGVQAVLATLRWGGAYIVVAFFDATVTSFFLWQGAVSLVTCVALVHRTYARLPPGTRRARFSAKTLRHVGRFAGGMFISAGLSFALTQADKLMISKLLPLDQLGYYMVAATAAGGLVQLITPMNSAVFPRLTQLATGGDSAGLAYTFERACQWMAAIITPVAVTIAVFARELLFVWTGDRQLSMVVAPLLIWLTLGTLFNGLMNIPYLLQIAHGWLRLSIVVNVASIVIILPAMAWLVPRHGPIAAAACWFALTLGNLLVCGHLTLRRFLPEAERRWFLLYVALPVIAAACVAAALKSVLPSSGSRMLLLGCVSIAGLCTAAAVVACLPNVRIDLWRRLGPRT